jgi:hypothetical protein
MRNLIYQYYIPYEANDKKLGGKDMPLWAQKGMKSAQKYANHVGAEYIFLQDKFFPDLDPRLETTRIHYDTQFEQYDHILVLDLDMLIRTKKNIFELIGNNDVAMVHELGVFNSMHGWVKNVMDVPLEKRGIIAYGKKLFGEKWMFPKSSLYPHERFRYMNGGVQLWSKEGRLKAREYFTSLDDYVLHTRYTEQMYVNLQLSQPIFKVKELDVNWNRLPYQWPFGVPDGFINHYLGPSGKQKMMQGI